MRHSHPLVRIVSLAVAGLLFCLACPRTARAQAPINPAGIAEDGAYGTNAQWEQGTYPAWYPELERYGTDWIEAGIAEENPEDINEGLLMLDWGFARMGPDGSFPGCGSNPVTATNANQATGGNFHTVSLFFEAASRAVLDLRAYRPTTYALAPGTYDAKLLGYQNNLATIAVWLTNTAWTPAGSTQTVNVPLLGQAFDLPYTHRFALLAAGLQECSVVTNNQTLSTGAYGANWWVGQVFPRQIGAGWLAIYTPGTNAPASLAPPGTAVPAGQAWFSATGVLPERYGFDASYGQVDGYHLCHYFAAATDPVIKNQVAQCLIGQLSFERSRESTGGVIDPTGSTRVGVDTTLTNAAQTKSLSTSEVMQAFLLGGVIDKKGRDVLAGIRYRDSTTLPNTDVVNADGSIGANTATSYNISLQKDGADWIQAGILHENDTQIQQGETILAWGITQQGALGNFPHTSSIYTDCAMFTEAEARSIQMLEGYHPISHPLNPALLTCIPSLVTSVDSASKYLVLNASGGYSSKTSASKEFTYAAALGESAGVLASGYPGDAAAAQTQSNAFLTTVLSQQMADGTNPESGLFSGNAQATSCLMAARLATYGTFTTPTKAALAASLASSLAKMGTAINPDGSFTYSSPAVQTTASAFLLGQSVTGVSADGVFYHRLTDMSLPGQ